MFTIDPDRIRAFQDTLDNVARCCMKTIGRPGLSNLTNAKLGKFLYGLMNQRLTIERRVRERGPSEFDKLLKFIGRALEALETADRESSDEKTSPRE